MNADGRLEVFMVGNDQELYHGGKSDPAVMERKVGLFWGYWPEAGDSVVVVNADGRLEVFMVGNDKELYHRWQEGSGGRWNHN